MNKTMLLLRSLLTISVIFRAANVEAKTIIGK